MKSSSLNWILAFILFSTQLQGQDLSFYLTQAKANSPLLMENRNQLEAASLDMEQLRAIFTKAQFSLSGGYLFAPLISNDNGEKKLVVNPSGSEENYFGYDLAGTNGGLYQGIIHLDQPLFNGTRYQATKAQTMVGARITENNIQLTEHELEKFIIDQYILCLQNQRETEYLRSLLTIINDQRNAVVKLAENGIAKQSDLSLITIEQKTLLTDLNKYQSIYRSGLMDLRVLCGIPDTTFQVLDNIQLQRGEDIALSHFTQKFELDSLSLMASQKVFELKYKPLVGVFANTGLNAVYAPTIANRFGLSAGINFTMNLTDGRQKSITQQRTEVLMRSTSQYKQFFYNQNSVRKSRIISELNSIDERLVLIDDQLQEYHGLLDLYKRELMYGEISVFNYISVLKSTILTQRDLVMLQTNKQLLINLYNYWNW